MDLGEAKKREEEYSNNPASYMFYGKYRYSTFIVYFMSRKQTVRIDVFQEENKQYFSHCNNQQNRNIIFKLSINGIPGDIEGGKRKREMECLTEKEVKYRP